MSHLPYPMDIMHESRLMSPVRVITQKWEQLPRIPREAQPNPIINQNNIGLAGNSVVQMRLQITYITRSLFFLKR